MEIFLNWLQCFLFCFRRPSFLKAGEHGTIFPKCYIFSEYNALSMKFDSIQSFYIFVHLHVTSHTFHF